MVYLKSNVYFKVKYDSFNKYILSLIKLIVCLDTEIHSTIFILYLILYFFEIRLFYCNEFSFDFCAQCTTIWNTQIQDDQNLQTSVIPYLPNPSPNLLTGSWRKRLSIFFPAPEKNSNERIAYVTVYTKFNLFVLPLLVHLSTSLVTGLLYQPTSTLLSTHSSLEAYLGPYVWVVVPHTPISGLSTLRVRLLCMHHQYPVHPPNSPI